MSTVVDHHDELIVVDGHKLANQVCNSLLPEVEKLTILLDHQPNLTVILVGNRPESLAYVRRKKIKARSLGIDCQVHHFEEMVSTDEILVEIDHLNNDPRVQAILVQLPLPQHLATDQVLARVKPEKDVDGFHPLNVGGLALGKTDNSTIVPCTPLGVMEILTQMRIPLKGQLVVLIGASRVVGLPLFHLLLAQEATVIVCHKYTKNLPELSRQADIVISACGQPEMVTTDWIKPGAVVIDVGINFIPDADHPQGRRLVGDVHFESVKCKARLISPVPGGVGPLTVAMLMSNTVQVTKNQLKLSIPIFH